MTAASRPSLTGNSRSPLTAYPHSHSGRRRKLLVLAPRRLFSSVERKAELKHLLCTLSAWKALAERGRSSLDFTLLSARHPLEEIPGLHSLRQNHLFSSLSGFDVESAVFNAGAAASQAWGPVTANFVSSSGIGEEKLLGFLEQNSADFAIPVAGWHHWPTTRWLAADSCALSAVASSLAENGRYAGVLAVGWPVFDAGLRVAKERSLPSFHAFYTPSKLEAQVSGSSSIQAVVARELAAVKHGQAILSFDVAGLQWLLKNYAQGGLAGEKESDFENVIEVLELLSDSAGLMRIASTAHAHPNDRRSAITLLKQARSTLDSHSVSQGDNFVSSKYCAAFNAPLEVAARPKKEVSSGRRSLQALASLEGPPLSKSKPKKVFSLVFTDASDASLQAFSKALSQMPDAAFVVRADAPKLADRLKKISGEAMVSQKIAFLPGGANGSAARGPLAGTSSSAGSAGVGEVALLAASSAIVFPNPVASLLHYEDALCAVHSARQAGVTPPAIVATSAAPFLLKHSAVLPPDPSYEDVLGVLSAVSAQGDAQRGPAVEKTLGWSWEEAALKLVEFLSARL